MDTNDTLNLEENHHVNPLASVHTNTLVKILNHFGISLLVTTYQAGKLVVLRSEGEQINTHFKDYQKPMGLAAFEGGFAMGSGGSIVEFYNNPSSAQKISSTQKHDACYIPRNTHVTGDIDIHEMAYDAEGELWFVNTKFSCLCNMDREHSFLPRWKPPFITGYDLFDRCHLNGLSLKDGKPKYVTTLGKSDEPMGWRKNRAFGGTLIDVENDEILLDNLSMPHSPRWYRDRVWILESGHGNLSYYDFKKRATVSVAELPGFTRGIDFIENIAFIGLSKVRESAVFSGIPLTKRTDERICGVWAVDIDTGDTLGFLKFTEGVEEIFAISIVPHNFPEVLEWGEELQQTTYVLPDEAMELVKPPSDVEIAKPHFLRGNELYGAGRVEEAIESFKKCLEIEADYLPARLHLAIIFGDIGKYEEAELELKIVIENEARQAEAYNSLGFIYYKQMRLQEAKEMFKKAVEIEPKYEQARSSLAQIEALIIQ